ncbi:MAG: 1-deoxy-D-xylulose-5-phosphate reductoisomerase, partial [Candidatus Caenarcaniphilales bacterium]|nr:1-deoxy-D-xylulose-5-phosphate reductoisomerase [Candidatus Caenarcaniphilales bacterium]
MPQKLSIIGSTGSIGTQCLDIVRSRPDEFEVVALAAGSKIDLLKEQIKEFKPKYICINNNEARKILASEFPQIIMLKDIVEIAALENIDIVVSAIVGIAGLEANIKALSKAKRVAIANKETLVAAKDLVRESINKYKSELIPIDSEHVAIHQCLKQEDINSVQEILLTSSGGPFRTWSIKDFDKITIEQALNHPTWKMGPKITIDSSTLVNKGLEIIEINSLFDIDYDKIQVVIHPQSIVHSAVTFVDGNTIAQLSSTDMRVPIQYALDYPARKAIKSSKSFSIFEHGKLEFEKPDFQKFPALALAYAAGKKQGIAPSIYNSANEVAVELFLQAKIPYSQIIKIIESELNQEYNIIKPSIQDI